MADCKHDEWNMSPKRCWLIPDINCNTVEWQSKILRDTHKHIYSDVWIFRSSPLRDRIKYFVIHSFMLCRRSPFARRSSITYIHRIYNMRSHHAQSCTLPYVNNNCGWFIRHCCAVAYYYIHTFQLNPKTFSIGCRTKPTPFGTCTIRLYHCGWC